MQQKQRIFIYDPKEIGVLILLGVLVAIFAFTFGVHLGKRIGPKTPVPLSGTAPTVPTIDDQTPNILEINEQSKGVQQAIDESLDQAAHDEIARTGSKLDVPRQIDLPSKAISKNNGSTTLNKKSPSVPGVSIVSKLNEEKTTASATNNNDKPLSTPRGQSVSSKEQTDSVEKSTLQAVNSKSNLSERPVQKPAINKTLDNPNPGISRSESNTSHESSGISESSSQTTASDLSEAKGSSDVSGPFGVQVGSHQGLFEANQQIAALEAKGLKPFLHSVQLGGRGKWYRVFVGSFPSKDRAEKAGQSYKAKHMIDSFVISKITASVNSPKE